MNTPEEIVKEIMSLTDSENYKTRYPNPESFGHVVGKDTENKVRKIILNALQANQRACVEGERERIKKVLIGKHAGTPAVCSKHPKGQSDCRKCYAFATKRGIASDILAALSPTEESNDPTLTSN